MVDYSQVVFLDLDLILTGFIDEPFKLLEYSSLSVAAVPDINLAAPHAWDYPLKGGLNSGSALPCHFSLLVLALRY